MDVPPAIPFAGSITASGVEAAGLSPASPGDSAGGGDARSGPAASLTARGTTKNASTPTGEEDNAAASWAILRPGLGSGRRHESRGAAPAERGGTDGRLGPGQGRGLDPTLRGGRCRRPTLPAHPEGGLGERAAPL